MRPLRVAVVLSGGASLGAYQAGATAALLVAVQELRDHDVDVAVDGLGGASAGALVAVLGAHALLDGRDPVEVLHEAWVETVDLTLLLGDPKAPLTFEALRGRVGDVLTRSDGEREVAPQECPIALHLALTGLHGLRYPLRSLGRDDVEAVTYADWDRFVLHPGGGLDQLVEPDGVSPVDVALASAANPGAFRPRLLDRGHLEDHYLAHGIERLPGEGRLWFSDGGLVQSQPVGRVLGAVQGLDVPGDARRLVVLVDPRSEGPSGDDRFADGDVDLGWLEGLGRSLSIVPTQTIYDDLRRTAKENRRLEWLGRLVDGLAPHLDADGVAALAAVLGTIDDDREAFRRDEPARGRDPRAPDDAASLLGAVIGEIAGLAGKSHVDLDVISPLLLAEERGRSVPGLLAGEFLGDFGGFLNEDLRRHDFALGFDTGSHWLERSLGAFELPDGADEAALERVRAERRSEWDRVDHGDTGVADLGLREQLKLGRFVAHVLEVVIRESVHVPDMVAGRLDRLRAAARRVRPWG